MFPTEQIQRIIAAAKDGKSLLELTVYDGSDNGAEGLQHALGDRPADPGHQAGHVSRSLHHQRADEVADALAGDGELLRPRRAQKKDGEQTPVYSMSFELYENGVSRRLVLDYNDFVIAGALGKFDVKDASRASESTTRANVTRSRGSLK